MFQGWKLVGGLGVLSVLFSGCGGLDNFHQLDASANGYSMNRSGQPEESNAEEICKSGIRKVFALNGEGRKYAAALSAKCPGAEILYDEVQNPDASVGQEFLVKFDAAVADAKANGQGILFHCSCGCHRTGRLAAYYRMKYQGWSAEAAIEEMNDIGRDMDTHPTLPAQIYAMQDYILKRKCSQDAQFCFADAAPASAAQALAAGSPNSNP